MSNMEHPEDEIINRMAMDAALATLSLPDRLLIEMVHAYAKPDDYTGPWPATNDDIGVYIGLKFRGKPIRESTVRNRRDKILAAWALDHGTA